MPNWKKVIVSGSDAILNSITSSAGISSSGDIYAPNFYGNVDSASHATTVRVDGLNSPGGFSVLFSNNTSLYRDLDNDFTYNPNTNTLIAENIIGTASLSITSSYSKTVKIDDKPILSTIYPLVFSTGSNLYSDYNSTDLYYNPGTTTLYVDNIVGTASLAISSSYALTSSYADSSSYAEIANSINIDNDSNNRILTANGDGTINAESSLTYNGTSLGVNGNISQTVIGRALFSTTDDGGSNNLFQVGDLESARRKTVFEVRDVSGSFYFFTENNDPHYLNSSSLFISGNVSSSGLYVDNRDYSTAIFTGLVDVLGLTVGDVQTSAITGNWLSNNGNNRVITSNGNGTFNAESGLTFDGNELSLAGNLNVQGDIIAEQYIINSTVTNVTMSFSSGSTIFGDSLDDTHLFTGSADITGSFILNGMSYPITDGLDRQVIKTDGNGNLSFEYTENTQITVKNISGDTISKGTPCFITGSGNSGNVAGIIPADAGDPTKMPAGIIAGETLADEAEGMGLINGFIQGVDTSQFEPGDTVYVAVGGGYTNIRPTGSALIQKLGNVEKKDNSNGSGVINGPGYYNEVPNITEGYTWVGNSDGVATAVLTSSFGDNLGDHTATQDLDMAGFSISASLNITASGNISASGYVSADYLVLNPNTTTTGSNDTEEPIDISLGDEEYKRGVIKRVFDFRENLASADDVDINNQIIANIGEFKKGTLDVTIELNGYRPNSESFNTDTASLNQNIKIHTVPTINFQGSAIDILLEDGASINSFVPLLYPIALISDEPPFILVNSLLKIDNEQIKFNIVGADNIDNANILLSSSLAIVYIDYQLYK
jgi:hypothetical protein